MPVEERIPFDPKDLQPFSSLESIYLNLESYPILELPILLSYLPSSLRHMQVTGLYGLGKRKFVRLFEQLPSGLKTFCFRTQESNQLHKDIIIEYWPLPNVQVSIDNLILTSPKTEARAQQYPDPRIIINLD